VTPLAGAAVQSDPEPVTTSPAPPKLEATPRALVTGAAIGVLLAAGNVYTSFKVSIIDGGNITAALLGFSLFATFRRLGRTPYGALENNITQTTASSAAVMSFVTGVVGPIPALTLMGISYPPWAIALWGASVAIFGVFVATLLRKRLIADEKLPFPTGRATGELIEAIYGARDAAVKRTRLLIGAALVAAAITWFRDAKPAFIPQASTLPGMIAGLTMTGLTLGISWSPLMVSTGGMLGLGVAGSMLLGGGIARGVLAPWLHANGIVAGSEFSDFNAWLIWPGLGLLIAGSFVPLLLDGGAIGRSLRDLLALARRTAAGQLGSSDPSLSPRLWFPLLAVSLLVTVGIGHWILGMPPAVTVIALVLAMLLANVSARAAGETDFAPGGSMGTVSLIALRNQGVPSSVLGGSISLGMSSQVGQTLWAMRAGHQLGASPRAQVGAQILGALLGAAVVVPVYQLIVSGAAIGSEKLPAIAALSYKATAEAVSGGLGALPRHAGLALCIALVAGTALTVVARTRAGRFGIVPSPAAIGCAFMLPFSSSMAIFAGACAVLVARRLRPSFDEPNVLAMAAGGIAGESVMGVIIAALLALGML
jgi:putative OPT family oligopeptide transporter